VDTCPDSTYSSTETSNYTCVECADPYLLVDGVCVECILISGLELSSKSSCQDICGDGKRFTSDVYTLTS
jgi:hypothetical protein